MKYHLNILQLSFIVLFSFFVLSTALVIDKRSADIVIDHKLPANIHHYQKRDVIDLHNSGASKTTTTATATATSKLTMTPKPTSAPSSNPGKRNLYYLFTESYF